MKMLNTNFLFIIVLTAAYLTNILIPNSFLTSTTIGLILLALFVIITKLIAKRKLAYCKQYLKLLDQISIPALIQTPNGKLIANKIMINNGFSEEENIALIPNNEIILGGKKRQISRTKLAEQQDYYIIALDKVIIDPIIEISNLFKNSSIAAIILDSKLEILYANNIFKTIVGSDSFESNFTTFLTEDSKDKLQSTLQYFDSQNQLEGPLELKMAKEDKTILAYISPIPVDRGNNFLFKIIDTTKYKTLEMNFVHSQKMQALGQLSGAIAHDFNNLLTAITGFSDLLLLRHPPGDKSFVELMQIKQNANRAANLVRQLLAFSRKQVLQLSIINITDSIGDLSNLVSRLIGGEIELFIEHSRDQLLTKVDQGQFEQVIVNLVVNARDAMPAGGKLSIKTKNIKINNDFEEAEYYAPAGEELIIPGDYILITISDTGVGISKEILDKIFEPFFSTKDALSGTGLGLSTVFGIIKQTGGYVRLKTTEGSGTTFYIFLKAAAMMQNEIIKENDAYIQDENEDKLMINNNNKGKILIVEDEAPVRMFGMYALGNKGYEVIEADCAETALEIIEREGGNIDLIITDVIMPGMTGPKMVEVISKKFSGIKYIFTSGYAEDSISYLSNVDCHFLSKPYSLRDLLAKVGTLLAEKS